MEHCEPHRRKHHGAKTAARFVFGAEQRAKNEFLTECGQCGVNDGKIERASRAVGGGSGKCAVKRKNILKCLVSRHCILKQQSSRCGGNDRGYDKQKMIHPEGENTQSAPPHAAKAHIDPSGQHEYQHLHHGQQYDLVVAVKYQRREQSCRQKQNENAKNEQRRGYRW